MRGKAAKELRQADASERLRDRETRTPDQQVKHLDRLLGKGQGATKERARLAKESRAA